MNRMATYARFRRRMPNGRSKKIVKEAVAISERGSWRKEAVSCCDVVMLTETFTDVLASVLTGGLKTQAAYLGKLEQLKETWPVKPPSGLIIS